MTKKLKGKKFTSYKSMASPGFELAPSEFAISENCMILDHCPTHPTSQLDEVNSGHPKDL